ncbi:MAG: hypothetical protein ACTSWP_10195 [Candidatus Freyarchaeota archaeon]
MGCGMEVEWAQDASGLSRRLTEGRGHAETCVGLREACSVKV